MSNAERGAQVRRALLAVARACAERAVPLPSNAMIGSVIGIDASQVCRHLNQLMNSGQFTTRQRGRRIYIEMEDVSRQRTQICAGRNYMEDAS
jgi:hypothetical protein